MHDGVGGSKGEEHATITSDNVTAAMRIDGTRLGGHSEETDAVTATEQPAEKLRRQRGRRGETGNEASAQQGNDEARRAHRRPRVRCVRALFYQNI